LTGVTGLQFLLMRPRRLQILAALTLICSAWIHCEQLTDSEKAAVAAVQATAEKVERCSSAEEIAEFKGKWVKVSWGPPQDVKFDVEKAASLLNPYKGTITFSIPYSGGEQHKTKEEAQQDTNLRTVFVSPVRYTLRVSEDSGVKLESMEIKNTLAGTWDKYNPVRPERFCWITAVR
jgi:hypothetical protein